MLCTEIVSFYGFMKDSRLRSRVTSHESLKLIVLVRFFVDEADFMPQLNGNVPSLNSLDSGKTQFPSCVALTEPVDSGL